MKKLSFALVAGLAVLTFVSINARAASPTSPKTASFSATATVVANCTISAAAAGLAFGNYDPAAATAATASEALSIQCSKGLPWSIALSSAGSWNMKDGSATPNTLGYSIFVPVAGGGAGSTTVWGASSSYGDNGSGSAQSVTLAGQVATGQYVPAGSYSDTVTATLTF